MTYTDIITYTTTAFCVGICICILRLHSIFKDYNRAMKEIDERYPRKENKS